MAAHPQTRYRSPARLLKALAHPTRLFLVDTLSREQLCVHELTRLVGVEMPTVSRHLAVLKKVGILADEKRGSHVFYRLRRTCVMRFFECLEAVKQEETPSLPARPLQAAVRPPGPRPGRNNHSARLRRRILPTSGKSK